ncbi:alpha/beta fold hydrolase [Ornithinimicrobium sp. Y1694]|uniref:alpha/beta fold hydrolase n=1 Tax=Ornithinimicrobium sp. Y1694 TaxID=3418590 RepID=UPI003CEA4C3B
MPETETELTQDVVHTPDGRNLQVWRRGEGANLVVLEAGLGFSGLYWGAVMAELAGHPGIRAVTYARAGYGESTPDPEPRTLSRLSQDLLAVVEAEVSQGVDRLVLVGHSWGGPIVRRAAEHLLKGSTLRAPTDQAPTLAGVILVDEADEQAADLYFSKVSALSDRLQELTIPLLVRTGLLRHGVRLAMGRQLDPAVRDALIEGSTTGAAGRTMLEENRQIRPGLRSLIEEPDDLGDLPVTVITGTRPARPDLGRSTLVQAHRQTAERYPQGRLVEAKDSRHVIPLTEPELVTAEISRLLEGAGQHRPTAHAARPASAPTTPPVPSA